MFDLAMIFGLPRFIAAARTIRRLPLLRNGRCHMTGLGFLPGIRVDIEAPNLAVERPSGRVSLLSLAYLLSVDRWP